jgi:hypothetical protein
MSETHPPRQVVFWHRELPPVTADVVDEHVVEATSGRVAGTLSHRDELWEHCYQEVMVQARERIEQEVARLGGHFAHVVDESLDPRHDDATAEAWLHGRFTFVLYRATSPVPPR